MILLRLQSGAAASRGWAPAAATSLGVWCARAWGPGGWRRSPARGTAGKWSSGCGPREGRIGWALRNGLLMNIGGLAPTGCWAESSSTFLSSLYFDRVFHVSFSDGFFYILVLRNGDLRVLA